MLCFNLFIAVISYSFGQIQENETSKNDVARSLPCTLTAPLNFFISPCLVLHYAASLPLLLPLCLCCCLSDCVVCLSASVAASLPLLLPLQLIDRRSLPLCLIRI